MVQLFSREQAGVGMNVHCLTVSLSNARFQELSELHGCVETNRTSGWHSIALGLVLWASSMSPRQSLSCGLTPGPLPQPQVLSPSHPYLLATLFP